MNCDVRIEEEAGYKQALIGLGLSYNKSGEQMIDVSKTLYKKDKGHNKFLESMQIWLLIRMPRYWWQEFDTYRVGVTKQSESTMHTIFKRDLTQDNFVYPISLSTLSHLNKEIMAYKWLKNFSGGKLNKLKQKDNRDKAVESVFKRIKTNLPEGFLQTRMVNINYKVLRNIIQQRKNHRLEEWEFFINYLLNNCKHREYLV